MKWKFFSTVLAFGLVGVPALLSFKNNQAFNLKESIARGKEIYVAYCISCHMEQGTGVENTYPPLVKSDYLMADKKRSILQVLNGANGEMKVNGKIYNAPMTGFDLTDEQVSDVLNYSRNSWGNKGAAIKPDDVKAARK
jgi:mono/diheme cytochrome c family protein